MKRVKDGDILLIGDISYKLGETSAPVINLWVEGWESGSEIDDTHEVHLWRQDGKGGGVISASKIKKALVKV